MHRSIIELHHKLQLTKQRGKQRGQVEMEGKQRKKRDKKHSHPKRGGGYEFSLPGSLVMHLISNKQRTVYYSLDEDLVKFLFTTNKKSTCVLLVRSIVFSRGQIGTVEMMLNYVVILTQLKRQKQKENRRKMLVAEMVWNLLLFL